MAQSERNSALEKAFFFPLDSASTTVPQHRTKTQAPTVNYYYLKILIQRKTSTVNKQKSQAELYRKIRTSVRADAKLSRP